jgi:hypothetical protein
MLSFKTRNRVLNKYSVVREVVGKLLEKKISKFIEFLSLLQRYTILYAHGHGSDRKLVRTSSSSLISTTF